MKIIKSISISLVIIITSFVTVFASELQYANYIGSGYIIGNSNMGNVEIYVPTDTDGKWGTTNNGFLCNISSSTIYGIMYTSNGDRYSFRCSSFDTPEVRLFNSTGYTYTDLNVTVSHTNMTISDSFPSASPWRITYPIIIIGLMGVIVLCLMRSKH